MDKIKITINGKTFEAEGEQLIDILGNFLNEEEPSISDFPNVYNTYEEYLNLNDFDPSKCTNNDQLHDLKNKLQQRFDWIKKNPNANLKDVKEDLKAKYDVSQEVIKRMSYMKQAYEAIQLYCVNVNNHKQKYENQD